jgi:hypothetical protein
VRIWAEIFTAGYVRSGVSVRMPNVRVGDDSPSTQAHPIESGRLHGTLEVRLHLHFGEHAVRTDIIYPWKCLWIYASVVVVVDDGVQIVAFFESHLGSSQVR